MKPSRRTTKAIRATTKLPLRIPREEWTKREASLLVRLMGEATSFRQALQDLDQFLEAALAHATTDSRRMYLLGQRVELRACIACAFKSPRKDARTIADQLLAYAVREQMVLQHLHLQQALQIDRSIGDEIMAAHCNRLPRELPKTEAGNLRAVKKWTVELGKRNWLTEDEIEV